jgi:hypothetical protein
MKNRSGISHEAVERARLYYVEFLKNGATDAQCQGAENEWHQLLAEWAAASTDAVMLYKWLMDHKEKVIQHQRKLSALDTSAFEQAADFMEREVSTVVLNRGNMWRAAFEVLLELNRLNIAASSSYVEESLKRKKSDQKSQQISVQQRGLNNQVRDAKILQLTAEGLSTGQIVLKLELEDLPGKERTVRRVIKRAKQTGQ